ncbi:MAG: hypothetical protein L0K86_27745 [Actinomycetia bacterium]|nr:hypothetical protein [Actinomycetes bacterium]
MSVPEQQKTIPSLLGPLSLLGVCLGMVAWMLPALYGGASAWLLLFPASGLLLMFLPVSSVRHFGTGLVASVLVWPFTVFGAVLVGGSLG